MTTKTNPGSDRTAAYGGKQVTIACLQIALKGISPGAGRSFDFDPSQLIVAGMMDAQPYLNYCFDRLIKEPVQLR